MARIYANENFYYASVEILRQWGHDVLTTKDVGNDNRCIPDEEVLNFAIAEKRIVLTFNYNHFKRLHRFHPPIISASSFVPKIKIFRLFHNAYMKP